jgi:hypothetical protein
MAANSKSEPEVLHHERQEAAKLYHERKARKNEKKAIVKEWYERNGDKIVKKMKMENGNVHSVFYGNIKKLKKAGLKIPKYTYADDNEE